MKYVATFIIYSALLVQTAFQLRRVNRAVGVYLFSRAARRVVAERQDVKELIGDAVDQAESELRREAIVEVVPAVICGGVTLWSFLIIAGRLL